MSHPFTVLYWPTKAIAIVKSMPEDVPFLSAEIGRFCDDFVFPDGSIRSKNIILYALGFERNADFVPVCQMLSEDVEPFLFKRFFGSSVRSRLRVPRKDYLDNRIARAMSVFRINYSPEQLLNALNTYAEWT